jgi:kynurenine formamidase
MSFPTYRELRERTDAPAGSSWGVFGPGDQLGSANNVTPEAVVAAAGLIRTGEMFNLDYPVNTFVPSPAGTRPATRHQIFSNNPNHRDDWLDSFYLQATSQIDGLRHMRHPEHGFYGGVPDEAVDVGTPDLGIGLVAEKGIAGRGVLLDLGRYLEKIGDPIDLSTNRMITPAELDAAAADAGITFRPGDILLLRLGWVPFFLGLPLDQRPKGKGRSGNPGLIQSEEMLAWLWDHRFALIAADNSGLEATPVNPDSGWIDPDEPPPPAGPSHNGMLHRPLLALLGMLIGELWNLEPLARSCAADGVYEFFLTAKPLNLVGGVGSPANAVAIK